MMLSYTQSWTIDFTIPPSFYSFYSVLVRFVLHYQVGSVFNADQWLKEKEEFNQQQRQLKAEISPQEIKVPHVVILTVNIPSLTTYLRYTPSIHQVSDVVIATVNLPSLTTYLRYTPSEPKPRTDHR